MNLYFDDDSAKSKLVALLRQAGHRVSTPAECGMVGASDARHFEYATRNRLVLLTRNYDDFAELHDVVLAADGVLGFSKESRTKRLKDGSPYVSGF